MQGQKRGNSYNGDADTKRSRDENSVTMRFLVCSQVGGGIIGRGGSTVKRLRDTYSAQIEIPDAKGPERVLSFRAEVNQALELLKELVPMMDQPPYPGNEVRGKVIPVPEGEQQEVNFLVHESQAGGIIGRGGEKIKEIRERSSARIKVFTECLMDSTERIVAIAGDVQSIVDCVEAILEVLKASTIRGQVALYDPCIYDDYQEEYNQYPVGGGFPQGNFGGQQGNFGGNMMMGQMAGQNFPQQGANFNGANRGNMMGGNNPAMGQQQQSQQQQGMQNNAAAPGTNNEPKESTQVTIPEDKAGCIIGKGGERLNNIRAKSGADVRMGDRGSGDRLITICGTHTEIQHAQYLMQQCVKQYGSV